METIGFIGLGRMGRPMATNMARQGFQLLVNDVNPDAVAALTQYQARAAETAAEVAAGSGTVITMLP
ncbi:MAG: NAD(P)-binding domain-containing protein, partial [Pseudomonadota bacterium]